MLWLSTTHFSDEEFDMIKLREESFDTKQDILKALETAFDLVYQRVKTTNEEEFTKTVDFFAGPKSKLQILNLLHDHVTHHRGQLVVYLNLNGIKKTPELYQSYGEVVEFLKGKYLTAGDVNTFKEDLIECSKVTKYVYGINVETSGPTSRGLFHAIKLTNNFINNSNDLRNVHISISGVGKVGGKLAVLLSRAGAKITASSIKYELIKKLKNEIDALIETTKHKKSIAPIAL